MKKSKRDRETKRGRRGQPSLPVSTDFPYDTKGTKMTTLFTNTKQGVSHWIQNAVPIASVIKIGSWAECAEHSTTHSASDPALKIICNQGRPAAM